MGVDPTHPLTQTLTLTPTPTRTQNGPETRLRRVKSIFFSGENVPNCGPRFFLLTLTVTYNFPEIYNLPLEDPSEVPVRSINSAILGEVWSSSTMVRKFRRKCYGATVPLWQHASV